MDQHPWSIVDHVIRQGLWPSADPFSAAKRQRQSLAQEPSQLKGAKWILSPINRSPLPKPKTNIRHIKGGEATALKTMTNHIRQLEGAKVWHMSWTYHIDPPHDKQRF